MPVVVKEAFRHDLDSGDQRKVLRWRSEWVLFRGFWFV